MLSHVRKTRACGLPDGARSGELHTNQDIDGRVLTCAVRANDRHTHSEVHDHNRGFALDRTGLREGELHRLVAQLEVRLLYQVLLREHGEGVTLRSLGGLQPPVLEINDVRSQVVQEGSGVRGADNAAREGFEPVLKPPEVIL